MERWHVVLLAFLHASCSAAEEGELTLDPCGPGTPPAAIIDVSERSDLFHPGPDSRIAARVGDAPEPSFPI